MKREERAKHFALWTVGLLVLAVACTGEPAAPAVPVDHANMPGMDHGPGAADATAITPSAAATAMMGLRTSPVRAGVGQVPRRAPASVSFDPTASVRVTTQSGGQVRSLSVPALGGAVRRGQVLAQLYDPALRAILEEVRIARTLDAPWQSAAAARARASGIGDAEIQGVAAGGAVPETFPIRAPINGVVSARPVAEGAWIAPGGVLALLVDPTALLVDLVVDGSAPPMGTAVALRDPSGGNASIAAIVVGVLPEATVAGLRVRVRPLAPLTPGRPLVAEWTEETAPSLWVPASSLVDTGTRRVVFVTKGAGFVPRAVEPGMRAGDEIEVRSGVTAGESVAAGAAFLLDSETQIGDMGHAGHGG